jgi:hypothetical protein
MDKDGGGHQQSNEPEPFHSQPIMGRATTQFERSFGPSCLLSLIIVLLLLLLVRRYLQVSWPVVALLSVATWAGVPTLLVRWRPDRIVDDD